MKSQDKSIIKYKSSIYKNLLDMNYGLLVMKTANHMRIGKPEKEERASNFSLF